MNQYKIINESEFTKQDVSGIDLNLVTSITGPYQIDIMRSESIGCSIFLFSDIHILTNDGFVNQDEGSLYLPLYLDALFKKYPNTQFDLMLEWPHLSKLETKYVPLCTKSMMCSIAKQFENCYKGDDDKDDCNRENKNVRFHNVNSRYYSKIYYGHNVAVNNFMLKLLAITNTMQLKIINELKLDQSYENVSTKFELLKTELYKVVPKNGKMLGEYIIQKFVWDNPKYKKIDENIMIEINKFISIQLNALLTSFDIFKTIELLNNKRVSYYELLSLASNTHYFLNCMQTTLMDFTAIIRFAKILSYGSKNIIYIAGGVHIDTFKNFMAYIDKNVKLLKGFYDLDLGIYDIVQELSHHFDHLQIDFGCRIDARFLNRIVKKFVDQALKKEIPQDDITKLSAINKILTTHMDIYSDRLSFLAKNPHVRIVKIMLDEIEKNIIV